MKFFSKMFKLKRVWLMAYRGNWITWTTSDKIVRDTMLVNVNLL